MSGARTTAEPAIQGLGRLRRGESAVPGSYAQSSPDSRRVIRYFFRVPRRIGSGSPRPVPALALGIRQAALESPLIAAIRGAKILAPGLRAALRPAVDVAAVAELADNRPHPAASAAKHPTLQVRANTGLRRTGWLPTRRPDRRNQALVTSTCRRDAAPDCSQNNGRRRIVRNWSILAGRTGGMHPSTLPAAAADPPPRDREAELPQLVYLERKTAQYLKRVPLIK